MYLYLVEDQHLIQMALERKFIFADQVAKAKAEQKNLADHGIERSLWFLCLDLGYVDDKHTRELIKYISSSRVNALEIEGYVIQGRIGSGGMGDVFRGRNAAGNEVAVKLLSTKYSQHEEYAARFQREAKASGRLRHPHIARTLGAGEIEGQRWMMMELVHGKILKERINTEGPMLEADAQMLLAQMAHALRYAWQRGVLHRDVKPANIILSPAREGRNEAFCAKICDFGLAKTWQIAGEETGAMTRGELTHAGVALGTPHYMSPEQASGENDLDQRTDIYGLGATLYHALLGQTLYSGKSSAAIMYKQVTEALDLKPLEVHGTSSGFVRLLGAMLAKDRTRRLRDWDAVLNALRVIAPKALATVESAMPDDSSSDVLPIIPRSSALATAGSTTAGKTVVAAPRRMMPLAGLIAFAAVVSLALVASAFLLLGRNGGGLRASPETLAQVMLDAQRTGVPTTVVLEAGEYQGPFSFGVAHSHMTLSGEGTGVRITASSLGDEPLLRLQSGLQEFTLKNVTLVPGRRPAMEVQSGAAATVEQVRIEGGCRQILMMSGGELRLRGLSGRSEGVGLVIEGQSELILSDSAIASVGAALVLHHGSVHAERCRFSALGATGGALVTLGSAKADFSAVVIEAQGCDTAMVLQGLRSGSFRDMTLRGARTGLRADGATIATCDGITIEALDTGIEWIGPRDPAWKWVGLSVRAPHATVGLSGIDVNDVGARADQIQAVPLVAVAPR